jgi:type I restriction enzyme S subunit
MPQTSEQGLTFGELAESVSVTHSFCKPELIFLNTSDIYRGRVLHRDYTAVALWPGQAKKSIQKGDILFSEIRPANGRYAFVDFDADDYVVSTKLMVIRPKLGKASPRFLYHFLTSRKITEWLQHLAESRSGTFPQITFDQVAELKLPRLNLAEQRSIEKLCDTLDDKIEHNRRTALALERLARAIFRAWFVDFEPVKAKTAGATAFPSMPQVVYDALPTTFTDSAIGPVPEGWALKAIGDVVTVKGGGTPRTKTPEYWDGGEHCWATPKDMSRLSHPVLLNTERRITDAGVNSISSGILPVGTVLVSSRAPVGYLAIAGVPTAINQGFIAMVCDGPLPPTYVLNWAFTSLDAIKAHASGTTFPEISKKNFRPLPVVVPTPDVIVGYRKAADPLFDLLTACVKENAQLVAMRDYLLPKLLSGAVSIRP